MSAAKLSITGLVVTVLAVMGLLAVAEAQSSSDLFEAGERAFSQGDYLSAAAYFEDARAAGSQGPAVHYNLGVCHYRLGNYRAAEAAFRVVSGGYPAMRAMAEYNLGLTLLKQGQTDAAMDAFRVAREDSSDAKISLLAERMLRRLTPAPLPAPEGPSWAGFIDLGVGHDDNVALIDDASLPAGQSMDSSFTELFAILTGPLAGESGLRFDASAYVVRYPDAARFDQEAVRLGGVYHWLVGAFRVELGPYVAYSTLDGDGFEQRLGAGALLRRSLTDQTFLDIRYAREEVDDVDPQFGFVAGSRDQLRLGVERRTQGTRLVLAYDLELNDRRDANVSPTRNRLSLRYRRSVNGRWTVDAAVALRKSRYDDLPVSRDERLVELSLGGARALSRGWQLSGQYRWADNDADVVPYAYQRNRISLGITKNF